jgi:hypothetical protein
MWGENFDFKRQPTQNWRGREPFGLTAAAR